MILRLHLLGRFGLAVLLLCCGISLQAQDLCAGQSDPFTLTNVTGRVSTYTIPAGFSGSVDLSITGGNGGRAAQPILDILGNVSSTCASNGGRGNIVDGRVRIDATTPGALRPGGSLRFIIGEGGENEVQGAGFLVTSFIGGGGGGGSAILYQAPSSTTWDVVLVAGGGGGAYQVTVASVCGGSNTGGNAYLETNPANTGGGSAAVPIFANDGGGGGGAVGKGGGTPCIPTSFNVHGGFPGLSSGGAGGSDEGCPVIVVTAVTGGFGFGGGGAGVIVGGGGGGYAGGDARPAASGAGGGSFVSAFVSSESIILSGNGNGGNGAASFTIMPDPAVALCQPDFDVILPISGTAAISLASINNGSSLATCGVGTISIDVTSVNCSQAGQAVTVTLSAGSGNAVPTCTTNVTVIDNVAPVFDLICQLDQTYTTEDGDVCPADAVLSLNEGDELDVFTGWTVGGVDIESLNGCVSDNCTATARTPLPTSPI
jgi:hypothetical protein